MAATATVSPGVVLSENEEITISKLNALGTPTVNVEGAIGTLLLSDDSVTNAKINSSAAIQHDKLAALSTGQLIVGNAGTPTAATVSGDVTIAANGAVTIADNAVTAAKLAVGAALPAGSITQYAGSSAPDGWLFANGDDTLNTFTYKDLHEVISDTYGGTAYSAGVTDQDGVSTTFTLPDLRGRIPVGVGQQTSGKWDSSAEDYSGSGTNFALAATGGTEDHKLTTSELAAHNHDTWDFSTGSSGSVSINHAGSSPSATTQTQNTGGDGPHNNLQPYIALNYIIKT